MHKIMSKTGVSRLRVQFALPSRFINADEFFSLARIFAKTIISDPIKPGRKFRFPPKAADVFVDAQKSFLSQIVGQRKVGPGELSKQTAHGRLMPTDQLAKGVLVVINKNSRDKVGICELHYRRLG